MPNRKHLSRLAMPKNWPVKRKGTKWIIKPSPGPHSLKYSLPLNIVLKEMLKYSKTSRESKQILNKSSVLVNNRIRKELKFPVGFMDVISVPLTNEYFRVGINRRNKFYIIPIKKEEANLRPCKITGKTILKKGKTQLNFYNGTNMIVDKDGYKVNDTLVVDMSGDKPKIKKHVDFGKGSKVIVFEGKFTGYSGVVEDIKKRFRNSSVIIKSGKEKFETLSDYVFVIDDSISYEVKKK